MNFRSENAIRPAKLPEHYFEFGGLCGGFPQTKVHGRQWWEHWMHPPAIAVWAHKRGVTLTARTAQAISLICLTIGEE